MSFPSSYEGRREKGMARKTERQKMARPAHSGALSEGLTAGALKTRASRGVTDGRGMAIQRLSLRSAAFRCWPLPPRVRAESLSIQVLRSTRCARFLNIFTDESSLPGLLRRPGPSPPTPLPEGEGSKNSGPLSPWERAGRERIGVRVSDLPEGDPRVGLRRSLASS